MLCLSLLGRSVASRVARLRLPHASNPRRSLATPANPKPDSSKAPAPTKDAPPPRNINKDDNKAVGPLRPTRKPTVAGRCVFNARNPCLQVEITTPSISEEISFTKRIDLKRLAAGLLAIIASKIASFDDPNIVETMWKQVGEDIWLEGATTRLVVRRYGKELGLAGQPRVVKRRQIRYWNTFEYITEALMFMLRFRVRIWEDIGTVEIAVPIEGSKRKGTFHVRAYTRDRLWIVDKAWIEDEEMIIELKRRIQLDFLLNPEPDLLIEFEKNRK